MPTEMDKPDLTLKVNPNPVRDIIYVRVPANVTGRYSLHLIDMHGKIVLRKNAQKSQAEFTETINVSSMPTGVYFLQLSQYHKLLMKSTVIKL